MIKPVETTPHSIFGKNEILVNVSSNNPGFVIRTIPINTRDDTI